MKLTKPPEKITAALLDVIVMPNGEVLCLGKTIGWVTQLGKYLTISQAEGRGCGP